MKFICKSVRNILVVDQFELMIKVVLTKEWMVCFMVVGLKNNVSHIIKSVPEKEVSGKWVSDDLLDCIKSLQDSGFKVRGVVSDDHASNVSA